VTLFRKAFITAATFLMFAGVPAVSQAADYEAERAFIESLGDKVLDVLRTDGLGPDARHQQLSAIFVEAVDLDLVGRYVLGRYWRAADEAQLSEYQQLFRNYAVDLYANRFNEYTGQTFEIRKVEPAPKDTVLVFTRILRPDGPPADVDFRVRDSSGTFKIIDVMVEGVSLVATKRSEFAAIIGRSGIDGLLAGLRNRSLDNSASG
jgi:phospholipid transport system substrate-binding protein